MKIAPPWRFILCAPSLTRMHIEMRSPSRTNTHQSGFPQIRQGLRRLTRPKALEVDVGIATLQAALFSDRRSSQSGNPALWLGGSESPLKRRPQRHSLIQYRLAELRRRV